MVKRPTPPRKENNKTNTLVGSFDKSNNRRHNKVQRCEVFYSQLAIMTESYLQLWLTIKKGDDTRRSKNNKYW